MWIVIIMLCLVSDGNKEFNLALPTAKRIFCLLAKQYICKFWFHWRHKQRRHINIVKRYLESDQTLSKPNYWTLKPLATRVAMWVDLHHNGIELLQNICNSNQLRLVTETRYVGAFSLSKEKVSELSWTTWVLYLVYSSPSVLLLAHEFSVFP